MYVGIVPIYDCAMSFLFCKLRTKVGYWHRISNIQACINTGSQSSVASSCQYPCWHQYWRSQSILKKIWISITERVQLYRLYLLASSVESSIYTHELGWPNHFSARRSISDHLQACQFATFYFTLHKYLLQCE